MERINKRKICIKINFWCIIQEKIMEYYILKCYQEYIDKETGKEKKRNSIILTVFSAFAGVLTISFENMGVIGIDFTNWLYVATFLLFLLQQLEFGFIHILFLIH